MKCLNPCLRSRTWSAKARRGRAKGIAMLEMMIVVFILGLLASVIVIAVMNQFENAKIESTRGQLRYIEKALRAYGAKNGLPSQNEGLSVLMHPPSGEPYLKESPKDAWNNDVLFFNPARRGSDPFEVVSKGPDGKYGTQDDIYAKKTEKQ